MLIQTIVTVLESHLSNIEEPKNAWAESAGFIVATIQVHRKKSITWYSYSLEFNVPTSGYVWTPSGY